MGNSYLESVSKVIKEHINDQNVMDQELNALKARQGTSLCDQATMTELLRQVDPNYHYNPTEEELEKKYLLSEDARNAIIDSEKVRYDPVITELTARLNPSRESTGMYLYAVGCMGQAGKNMMQEYLNAVRAGDDEAMQTLYTKLLNSCFEHYSQNAEYYISLGKSDDPRELVDHWVEYRTSAYFSMEVENLCKGRNIENAAWYRKVSERQMNDSQAVQMRMMMLASPISYLADTDQVLGWSEEQITRMANKWLVEYYSKPENSETTKGLSNPFGDMRNIVSGNRAAMDKSGMDALGTIHARDLIGMDMDGNVLSSEERLDMLYSGKPVYMMDRNQPDRLPVLVQPVDIGKGISVAGDAIKAQQLEPPVKPHAGIGTRMWDAICRAFGMEDRRTDAGRAYAGAMKKYKQQKEIYDSVRKLTKKYPSMTEPESLRQKAEQMLQKECGRSIEEQRAYVEEQRKKEEEEKEIKAQREIWKENREVRKKAFLENLKSVEGILNEKQIADITDMWEAADGKLKQLAEKLTGNNARDVELLQKMEPRRLQTYTADLLLFNQIQDTLEQDIKNISVSKEPKLDPLVSAMFKKNDKVSNVMMTYRNQLAEEPAMKELCDNIKKQKLTDMFYPESVGQRKIQYNRLAQRMETKQKEEETKNLSQNAEQRNRDFNRNRMTGQIPG